MRKVIKFSLMLSILFYIGIRFDVKISSEHYEDESGRVSLIYCIPDKYCD